MPVQSPRACAYTQWIGNRLFYQSGSRTRSWSASSKSEVPGPSRCALDRGSETGYGIAGENLMVSLAELFVAGNHA